MYAVAVRAGIRRLVRALWRRSVTSRGPSWALWRRLVTSAVTEVRRCGPHGHPAARPGPVAAFGDIPWTLMARWPWQGVLRIRGPSKPSPHTPTPRSKATSPRSEEHTSELQSRQYLVCRLLLEKK